MNESLVHRIYAAEAALDPLARSIAAWRVSPDIQEALGRLNEGYGKPPSRFILIGYPAKVDADLPPDTIIFGPAT